MRPAEMKNFKNEDRRIGVELEFHGVDPKKAATIMAEELGGEVERADDALYKVKTELGDFQLEVDAAIIKKLSKASEKNIREKKSDIDGVLVDALKVISDEIVPTELITPPLRVADLATVNRLQAKLLKEGAQGTTESLRFAFAAQLNPDILSKDVDYILGALKSFIVLTDWLKSQIGMDLTRKLTSFASDFPADYCKKIFHPDYSPALGEFIDDYLAFNPTRNRGLDMLPLFSFLDEKRVSAVVDDDRVKSRPTFHYRLPNCQLGLRSWNIEVEWSRWRLVEELAQNEDLFPKICDHYFEVLSGKVKSNWKQEINNYVETLRK